MDLEEHTLDPVIERNCAVCGTKLTDEEIRESLESGGRYLCSVHAAEELPAEELPGEALPAEEPEGEPEA